MSRTVQPYVDWLNLPPSDRPPNHFELLGLDVTEQNEIKIRGAYYKRVARVSMFQHGSDAELCQKVLDGLTVARDVLLDTQKRSAYVKTLQSDPPKAVAADAFQETQTKASTTSTTTFRSGSKAPQKVTQSTGTLSPSEVERLLNAQRAAKSADGVSQRKSTKNERKPNRLSRPFGMFSIMRTPDELLQEIVQRRGLTPYQAQRFVADEAEELIIGPYIAEFEIAEGSWGDFFQAVEIAGGNAVGLRLLRSTMTAHLPKLRRLSQKVDSLNSEQFQSVVDCGIHNDRPFLATQWIDGESLSALVQRDGPLSAHQAIYAIDQVVKGLKIAHDATLAHGELRPSKILVCGDGRVVIRDLALAQVIVENKSKIKQPQKLIQITPPNHLHYLPPETLLGEVRLRAQADIYSLGCILWFCLTGRTLFEQEDPLRLLIAHREMPIPSLLDHDSTLPSDFTPLLAKMLAKDPSQRFQSHVELRSDLLQLYKQLPPLNVKPSSLWAHVVAVRPRPTNQPIEGVTRYHRGRMLLAGLVVATSCVLLVTGSVLVARASTASQTTTPIREIPSAKSDGPIVLQSSDGNEIPTIQAEESFLIPNE